MTKTRIVFFVDILERHFDGVSNTIHQLAARLPKDLIEAIFITTFPPTDIENFPFQVYQCPYKSFFLYKDYRIGFPNKMKELPELLNNFDPHLIHYTSPTLMGKFALDYGKEKGIPVTTTYHTHFHSYMVYYFGFFKPLELLICVLVNKLTKWYYSRSAATFVPSEPMKQFLVDLGIEEQTIHFFRRGVNVNDFNPSYSKDSFKEDRKIEGRKVILFVSRLVKEKELETLWKTYKIFAKERDDIQFVVTGEGPFKSQLQKKMPRALFTGKKTKTQLATIYASSDVFIFPSITETFGNVVLEALASGLPVVAAAAGGPKGIIERSGAGFTVPPKDITAFHEKLSEILDNPELREALSANGIAYAEKQNWDDLCQQMALDLIEIANKD